MNRGAQIFINYRRDDEPYGAALLDHALSERFGPRRVFRAAKSISPGDDYIDALLTAARGSAVLLAVIGPRWLTATDQRGRPRLDDPEDWVRREIAEALRHRVRVIPVLFNTAMPKPEQLPVAIAALARCQYHRVHHRSTWRDIPYLAENLAAAMPRIAHPAVAS